MSAYPKGGRGERGSPRRFGYPILPSIGLSGRSQRPLFFLVRRPWRGARELERAEPRARSSLALVRGSDLTRMGHGSSRRGWQSGTASGEAGRSHRVWPQRPSRGSGEGAVVPQLSLPPTSSLTVMLPGVRARSGGRLQSPVADAAESPVETARAAGCSRGRSVGHSRRKPSGSTVGRRRDVCRIRLPPRSDSARRPCRWIEERELDAKPAAAQGQTELVSVSKTA